MFFEFSLTIYVQYIMFSLQLIFYSFYKVFAKAWIRPVGFILHSHFSRTQDKFSPIEKALEVFGKLKSCILAWDLALLNRLARRLRFWRSFYKCNICFARNHTDLGQNAVFHNFSRQIALSQYSGRSIVGFKWNRSKNFQNHPYG